VSRTIAFIEFSSFPTGVVAPNVTPPLLAGHPPKWMVLETLPTNSRETLNS
jgi:hypothetical protein